MYITNIFATQITIFIMVFWKTFEEWLSLTIYICDYLDYSVNSLESFIVEAESEEEAQEKAIAELKTLGIPKRYLIKIEEVI